MSSMARIPGGELANNKLMHVDRDTSVLEAARIMRKLHSAELLVVDKSCGVPFIFGILTASDIVSRVMAVELDPTVITAGDIAWSAHPASVSDS